MRHLLQEGQLYYVFVSLLIIAMYDLNAKTLSTTVVFALAAAILSVAMAPFSPDFQMVWGVPALAIETNMTCRVFRAMIMRSIDRDQDCPAAPVEAWTLELQTLELQAPTTDIDLSSASEISTSGCYKSTCEFYPYLFPLLCSADHFFVFVETVWIQGSHYADGLQ